MHAYSVEKVLEMIGKYFIISNMQFSIIYIVTKSGDRSSVIVLLVMAMSNLHRSVEKQQQR